MQDKPRLRPAAQAGEAALLYLVPVILQYLNLSRRAGEHTLAAPGWEQVWFRNQTLKVRWDAPARRTQIMLFRGLCAASKPARPRGQEPRTSVPLAAEQRLGK